MNFLTALLPLLAGFTQPIKDYFSYKQEIDKKEQDYKLAELTARIEEMKINSASDTAQLNSRLSATSKEFKQATFWLMCVPLGFSCIFPAKAAVMWQNFSLMPEWFQWLFMSVYSSIWGLPIVKDGYGAITEMVQGRRDYKLAKMEVNRKAVFDELKAHLFKNGMTQAQVDIVDEALDKA